MFRLDNNADTDKGYLGVAWLANQSASDIAAAHLVLTFNTAVNPPDPSDGNDVNNFIGQILRIRDASAAPVVPTIDRVSAITIGGAAPNGSAVNQTFASSGATRSITAGNFVGGGGAADAGQLLIAGAIVADTSNNPQGGSWTAAVYNDMTPVGSGYSDETGTVEDVTLGMFFSTTPIAQASRTATLTLTGDDFSPAVSADLGAIALEINC